MAQKAFKFQTNLYYYYNLKIVPNITKYKKKALYTKFLEKKKENTDHNKRKQVILYLARIKNKK